MGFAGDGSKKRETESLIKRMDKHINTLRPDYGDCYVLTDFRTHRELSLPVSKAPQVKLPLVQSTLPAF